MVKISHMETERLHKAVDIVSQCRQEIGKRLIGQENMVDGLLCALFAGGHVLLEGVPGLAKTLAVKCLAELSGLSFKRVQFTPDLLPADLTGSLIWQAAIATFSVRRGPIFANIVLADEINRAPAKVQSALLEAMEEKQVSIGEERLSLPDPFIVLATQNPIEQEGTYALPEAELDRFLLKLVIDYPSAAEEQRIVRLAAQAPEAPSPIKRIFGPNELTLIRNTLEDIQIDERLVAYAVALTSATRPPRKKAPAAPIHRHIAFGASPRASIALFRCAKVKALFAGRAFVLPDDIKAAAIEVLRHRIVLSFEAESEGLKTDDIVKTLITMVPLP